MRPSLAVDDQQIRHTLAEAGLPLESWHVEALLPAIRLALDCFLTNHPEVGAECLLMARYWSKRDQQVKTFDTAALMTITTKVVTPLYREALRSQAAEGDDDPAARIAWPVSDPSPVNTTSDMLPIGRTVNGQDAVTTVPPDSRRLTSRDAHITVGTSVFWLLVYVALSI